MLYRPVSSFSNTFYKLAAASSDPHIKKLSETYIVHYNFGEAIQNCTENKVTNPITLLRCIIINIEAYYTPLTFLNRWSLERAPPGCITL